MDENRKKHSFAVAERMKMLTKKYPYFGGFLDADEMFFLGLIHDIGREFESDADSKWREYDNDETCSSEKLLGADNGIIGCKYMDEDGRPSSAKVTDHEYTGARFLRKQTVSGCLCGTAGMYKWFYAVEHHGDPECRYISAEEAESKTALARNRCLQLMQYADMTTDFDGTYVSLNKRLENIGKRRGFDSEAYHTSSLVAKKVKGVEEIAGIDAGDRYEEN